MKGILPNLFQGSHSVLDRIKKEVNDHARGFTVDNLIDMVICYDEGSIILIAIDSQRQLSTMIADIHESRTNSSKSVAAWLPGKRRKPTDWCVAGFAGSPHVFLYDLEHYPASRRRRIYDGGGKDGWVNSWTAKWADGRGREQDWKCMGNDWGREQKLISWHLPNVRLGQRGAPTVTDWKRLWNAVGRRYGSRSTYSTCGSLLRTLSMIEFYWLYVLLAKCMTLPSPVF